MSGNVWQWVADWFRVDEFQRQAMRSVSIDPKGPNNSFDATDPGAVADAPKHVIRGGSFLCSSSYCSGYRVSARMGVDPGSAMSHVGFRLATDRNE